MPIYEYECNDCGKVEEVFQKMSESPLTTCRHCNGQLKKIISQSTFQLKGSGWYVTDYGGSRANNAGENKSCTCKNASAKKPEPSCKSTKKEK